ncbi:hypothetical protein C1I97_04615 [Streptomyces sp. NTH33]|nr:hypothetical protein C1I97_04615 [Streptomyces sp. NTH33]
MAAVVRQTGSCAGKTRTLVPAQRVEAGTHRDGQPTVAGIPVLQSGEDAKCFSSRASSSGLPTWTRRAPVRSGGVSSGPDHRRSQGRRPEPAWGGGTPAATGGQRSTPAAPRRQAPSPPSATPTSSPLLDEPPSRRILRTRVLGGTIDEYGYAA